MIVGDFCLMIQKYNSDCVGGEFYSSYDDAVQHALLELQEQNNRRIWIEKVDKVYLDNDDNYDDFDSHIVKRYK